MAGQFVRDPTPRVNGWVREWDPTLADLTGVAAGIRNRDTKFQLSLAAVLKRNENLAPVGSGHALRQSEKEIHNRQGRQGKGGRETSSLSMV